jgi:hypothetical protein
MNKPHARKIARRVTVQFEGGQSLARTTVIDGTEELLGNDILSSDYDVGAGDTWPGIGDMELPIPYQWKKTHKS